jgi:hypothetical protein
MEIKSVTEIYKFCQAPVVGVPIDKVVNTLVQCSARWLAAMLVIWTPK